MEPTADAPKPTETKEKKRSIRNDLTEIHRNAFKQVMSRKTLPCATGTMGIHPKDIVLFYGKKGPNDISRRIDFSDPSEEDLRLLSESCDTATFGVNSEDVLDETYRKAGKLDSEFFSCTFDPDHHGVMDRIRAMLLEGHESDDCRLWVERYKLNVYGPGSFFKAHKDTPRDPSMLGSLVVVLPTPHVGGALLFRHNEEEYTFDSAQGVAQSTPSYPRIAFAAFYSDVSHEVTPIVSGYRVTITYNIYLEEDPDHNMITECSHVYSDGLHSVFKALLDDHSTLSGGGLLAFGLKHEYAIKTTSKIGEDFIPLDYLETSLKGSAAVLWKVCTELGLDVELNMVYYAKDYRSTIWVLCPGYSTATDAEEQQMCDVLKQNGGKFITPRRRSRWDEIQRTFVDEPPDVGDETFAAQRQENRVEVRCVW